MSTQSISFSATEYFEVKSPEATFNSGTKSKEKKKTTPPICAFLKTEMAAPNPSITEREKRYDSV